MLDSSRRNAFLHLIHKNRWDNKWNLKDNKYTKFDNLYEIIINGKTYVIEYEPERDICIVVQNYKEHKCRTFKDFLNIDNYIFESKINVDDLDWNYELENAINDFRDWMDEELFPVWNLNDIYKWFQSEYKQVLKDSNMNKKNFEAILDYYYDDTVRNINGQKVYAISNKPWSEKEIKEYMKVNNIKKI